MNEPNDKDPHGMYQSELAALQIQIRRVVDQCEAVIGEKAHAIPFGMAVSETISELRKRAELAEAGAGNIGEALFGDDWKEMLIDNFVSEIKLLQKHDAAYEKLRDDLHALASPAPAAEVGK